MRKGLKGAFLLLLSGLIVTSCGEDSNENPGNTATSAPLTSAELLQNGPHGVGVTTMVFEDTSRPTMANGSYPGAPTRTLVTEIWYPAAAGTGTSETAVRDAPLALGGRPYPLIIYSHGFISTRTGGAYLARHLASYGYVTAAPDFPLTNGGAPGGPNIFDLANQPADVSFLIDRLLALNGSSDGFLAGAIDRERIALTGLSLGGATTFLAAFHPTLRDPRVRAAAPMAGLACFLGRDFYGSTKLPLLVVHGDLDRIVPYQQNGVFAYEQANAPKYLVTIAGGSHTGFTDGGIFDNLNNPDDVGCIGLSGSVPADNSGPSLVDLLGGSAAGIIMGDCPRSCVGPRLGPRSIRPNRQRQLATLSVFAFFEAHLRGSSRAREFLEHTLMAENPDVTAQFAQ